MPTASAASGHPGWEHALCCTLGACSTHKAFANQEAPRAAGTINKEAPGLHSAPLPLKSINCHPIATPSKPLPQSCRVFFSPLYPTVVAPGALAEPAPEDSSLDWQRFRGPLMGLDADTFERMHPFHFAMDLDMRVLQAGEALTRVLPGLRPGAAIQEVLAVRDWADLVT